MYTYSEVGRLTRKNILESIISYIFWQTANISGHVQVGIETLRIVLKKYKCHMVKTAPLLSKHSSLFAPVCDVMHVQLTKSTYRELKVECLIILAVVECDILLK